MADQSGQTVNPLKEHLKESATRYDFFKAVEIIHQLYPDHVPVGHDGPPSKECVQFKPTANFTFSPSEIASIKIDEDSEESPVSMATSFMSLYGRDGVLPWHYTTQLRKEIKDQKKDAMKSFMDIFNHRLISFFYRAASKYNIPRSFISNSENILYRSIGAFTGMATRGLRGELNDMPASLYKYSGIFQQPRSADSLEMMLCDMFSIPIQVQQFLGEWIKIDEDARCALGRRGQNNVLGKNIVIGRKTWSTQHKFKLNLGPFHYTDYLKFLPGSKNYEQLLKVTKLFCGSMLLFDIEYHIHKWSVPRLQLGNSALTIGNNSWIVKDTVENPNSVLTRYCAIEE